MIKAKVDIEPFYAMDVLAKASELKKAGHPVISLAVGQPAHKAPENAILMAQKAMSERPMSYTNALGSDSLRQAIANHYFKQYNVEISSSRVIVTNGSSAAFNLAFLSLFRRGDYVAIARPGYPAYRGILKALGIGCVEIKVDETTNYTITPQALLKAEEEAGIKINGLLLASPANPTGTVTSKQDLENITKWCDQNEVIFISDEIYHGLTFDGEETSAAQISDQAIIINSFSKFYCMTGWRVGWMIVPEHLVRPIECMTQVMYISAPEMSQIAAEYALAEKDEMEKIALSYQKNRDILQSELPKIGIELASPMNGAFYAWCDVSKFTDDSMEFSKNMLNEIYVATTPGRDFDPVDGHKYIRLSYAGHYDEIAEAIERLKSYIRIKKY